MKSIITLAEAARELTSAPDEQEVWLAVLEAAADELRAVKSWTEGRETVPGGISYIRPCTEWRITTAAFNQWRAANAPPPSQATADANTKPKRETQAERIARYVSECERRAAERGERFDRERMPGTKAEFLNLLHALDAELRSIKTVDSLDRYLSKTGCKWPLNAGKQSSAAPLYARLFPEARIRAPGAVSPQRRKA